MEKVHWAESTPCSKAAVNSMGDEAMVRASAHHDTQP